MFGQEEDFDGEQQSLIEKIFPKEMLKLLYYHACRVDIADNNDKAIILQHILGPEFTEVGTGTNRVAYTYSPNDNREFRGGAGLVYEIAIDRRG